jgi:hypothetical protein
VVDGARLSGEIEVAAGKAHDRALLDAWYVLVKACSTYSASHPSALRAAEQMQAALVAARPPLAIQFVGQAVFRDRVLVPLEIENFERASFVSRLLATCGVHEVCFDEVPAPSELASFGGCLAGAAQGRADALDALRVRGINCRELAHARLGEKAESVDAHVATATQVVLAISEAEKLLARHGEPWSWSGGVSVVRRLERAVQVDRDATLSAVELAPGAWTIPRRSVAAIALLLGIAQTLGVAPAVARAAAHALLGICLYGFTARGGRPFREAACVARGPFFAAPVKARSGIDPHRLRVCTLLHVCGESGELATYAQAALLELGYTLELGRCPEGVAFELTRSDLLAQLVQSRGRSDDPWLRALIATTGLVPIGAHVLVDDCLGVVVEQDPHGDPFRPRVLVAGRVMQPERPVRLFSPIAEAHGGST